MNNQFTITIPNYVPSNYSLAETFKLYGSLTLAQQERCIQREGMLAEINEVFPCFNEGRVPVVEEGFMEELIEDTRAIEFDLNELFKSVKGENRDRVLEIIQHVTKLKIALQEKEDDLVRQEGYRQEELSKVEKVLVGI